MTFYPLLIYLYRIIFIFTIIKMFNKYYQISSCYERENKETKENEVVIICNELKWKWVISSFRNYFTFTPEDFAKKFWHVVKKDQRNFWLERQSLEVGCEYLYDVHWITKDLPESLK